MTDTDAGAAQNGEGAAPAEGEIGPAIRVVAQFIRDLSFENPHAPESVRMDAAQPQIDLGVELNARGRQDGLFEVDLKLNVNARRAEAAAFHVEIVYGGLFQINGIPPEALEPVLLTECPRFMFPFVRRIISDITSDGGFPPMMLDPIDFEAVYAARRNQLEGPASGTA